MTFKQTIAGIAFTVASVAGVAMPSAFGADPVKNGAPAKEKVELLAQNNPNLNGKIPPGSPSIDFNNNSATLKIPEQDEKPTIIRQAGNYSAENPVVAIVVLNGQKDTSVNPRTGKPYTGQDVADILAKRFGAAPFNAATKTFVEEGGDHTAILYMVKGHAYGPYGVKDALSSMGLVSNDLEVLWTGETPKSSSVLGKPAPSGRD